MMLRGQSPLAVAVANRPGLEAVEQLGWPIAFWIRLLRSARAFRVNAD